MKVTLNPNQERSLSEYFSIDNPFRDVTDPELGQFDIEVRDDQLVVNGAYLHFDGEWATYSERDGPDVLATQVDVCL